MNILDFFQFWRAKWEQAKPQFFATSLAWMVNINYNIDFKDLYNYYAHSPYLTAVINRITKDVGSQWLELRKEFNNWDDEETIDPTPIIDLLSYKNPTQPTSLKKFLEQLVKDIEICWNSYVYVERVDRMENWKITWIERVDPRYMSPIVNEVWKVLWYYQNLNWIRVFFDWEVYHLKAWQDRLDQTIWESKMKSLFTDLEMDQQARESNLAFFLNNQTPSSLIIMDEDWLVSQENRADVEAAIKDIFCSWSFKGWKNHHKSAMVQWVKEVIKVQDKMSDMEFYNLRHLTMKLVCAVYWVPQDLIWFTETSNRSTWNVQSDVYLDFILAKEQVYQEFLTNICKQALWEEFKIVILQDNIRLLKKRAETAVNLYKSWLITLNEAREVLQYEPDPSKEWLYANDLWMWDNWRLEATNDKDKNKPEWMTDEEWKDEKERKKKSNDEQNR